jgi:quinol monooxygenase YgiN
MISTLVIFQVVAGRAAEFEAAHRELIALMGRQPGCIEIRAHRSLKDPLEYMVYGSWGDKEAWECAHQTPRFKELFKSLPLVEHTLSRGSFFEPLYGTKGTGECHRPKP